MLREPPPSIVAEALAVLGEPPLPLRAGPQLPARRVAAAIARAALPPERRLPAPHWLRAGQITLFHRTLAALERFGGVLVAEPTGAGKTYIALAAAAAMGPGPHHCLVPAALAAQWRATAASLGLMVVVTSHERASRGRLPDLPGLAIIDESHHYRNPATRRYRNAARWLVGRRAILLTATPLVNRVADLCAQLALVLRDDALAQLGVPSLRRLADAPTLPAAVARVVLASARPDPALPARRVVIERPDSGLEGAVRAIDGLALSRSPAIAALIRGVLLRAAASSPAALAGALRRYRLLLLHASDARAAGVTPGRAALRQWIGEAAEQTALWPLLADDGDPELVTEDLGAVSAAEMAQAVALRTRDSKAARLAALLTDGRRTLVFTAARETALWLRDRLGTSTAWCTGDRAGIGHTTLSRSAVLAGFRPGADRHARMPSVLIATDVAAEGLDLQRAERVVHYDLPWTPMRLEQREGRAARLGNQSSIVDVIRFDPPDVVERRLRQTSILRAKAALPRRAGLAGAALERWRTLAERMAGRPAGSGVAVVEWAGEPGFLAAVSLDPIGATAVWFGADGEPRDDPGRMADALGAAASACESSMDPGALARAMDLLRRHARLLIRQAHAAVWLGQDSAGARVVARRLGAAGRDAARRRSMTEVEAVDRALRFLARGHTAGEAMLIAEMAAEDGEDGRERILVARLAGLSAERAAGALGVRLEGLILFRSEAAPLR
jgi:superfamily II DNA or RNA helicase